MSIEADYTCCRTLQKYWRRIGLFPKKMEDFTIINYVKISLITLIFSSPFLFGTLGYAYVAYRGGAYSGVIFAVYCFNFVAIVQACILIFLSRSKQTLIFLENLGSTKYGKPKNFDHTLDLIEKATVFLYYTIIVEEFFLVVTSYFRNALCEEKALLNDDRIVCGLVIPFWAPFKIPYAFWIVSIYLVFYLPYLAFETCANVMYIGCIVPTLLKIQQLKDFLREIDFQDEFTSHRKLKSCAEYHSELVELVDQMNETVGFIMSPVQNVLIVIMIGILEFQAVNEKNVFALLQLIVWLLIEFVACFSGQMLEDASASVMEVMYDIKWYNMHPSLRNTFKTFHAQVQITMHYKMQPLIILNMEYFYKVMKSSYSFLMFLNNF